MKEWFLGIDPGLKTGFAVVYREGDSATVVDSAELDPEEIAPKVRLWTEWWRTCQDTAILPPRLTVVCEAFVITQRTATLTSQPWSLEHIGIVKQCMRDVDMDLERWFVLQKPGVKVVMDNDKLRRVELWHKGGAGHANDALRHIAVRMINVGWRDERLLDKHPEDQL